VTENIGTGLFLLANILSGLWGSAESASLLSGGRWKGKHWRHLFSRM